MIGTEIFEGAGLGNQLFFYVTTRCIAEDLGYDFGLITPEYFANNIHSDCGLYFMDLDMGKPVKREDFKKVYEEKEDRLFIGNSKHDLIHGAYVTGTDEQMFHVEDGTLLVGNMQSEEYYIKHKEEIREWLRVKEEYDCMDYCKDNLCIIHLRCSDYLGSPELYLKKKYWLHGMKNMKKINPDMEFMIITNDVNEAGKILPGIPAYNFDLAKDYAIIKNAKYLLLANSSFTYFPVFTSETVKVVIAPKYWARHNVSDGYWASEQNIYTGFTYQDRKGKLFSAEECRKELAAYKVKSKKYKRLNQKLTGVGFLLAKTQVKWIYGSAYAAKIARGVKRRILKLVK
ncbi:MAG: glycosyl transferase [Lachnospiraceae bacterium]|nr:glycosyl transferase [Lachnospiraceae bacterium]